MTQKPIRFPTPQTIEECLRMQAHFVGIPRITKKSYMEFYRRGKNMQVLNVGWITNVVDSGLKDGQGRMPSLKEVEDNINLTETIQTPLTKHQWKNSLHEMINMVTDNLITEENNSASEAIDTVEYPH